MDQSAYFEQMRQKRKNEILEVAKHILLTEGTDTFNIQQIAREADISTVTLYKYFKNSDEILATLVEQLVSADTFLSQLPKIMGEALEALEQLHSMLYAHIYKQRQEAQLLVMCEVLLIGKVDDYWNQPVLRQQEQIYGTMLRALLKKAQEEGQLREELELDETVTFIEEVNLAMLRNVAMMDQKTKKSTRQQQVFMQQYLNMLMGYLRVPPM